MFMQKNDDLLRRNDQKFLVLLLSFLFIYFLGLSSGTPHYVLPPSTPKLQVDLNTADEAELLLLPGIGAILAKRLLEYRTKHGSFQRNEDILKIQGIGPKKAEKILPVLKQIKKEKGAALL